MSTTSTPTSSAPTPRCPTAPRSPPRTTGSPCASTTRRRRRRWTGPRSTRRTAPPSRWPTASDPGSARSTTTPSTAAELPKTSALFSRVTKNLDKVDAAKNHYGYLRPYVRLGFVGDGGDIYESQDGSYGSLTTSGSYPSGHTYGGYEAGTILATLLPELAPSILARTSEYGNNRIVLGFHYPLDVMGGRISAQATVAHRWADPDFEKLLTQAHTEMENVLLAQCEKEGYGDTLAACEGDSYAGLSTAQHVDLYTRA